MGRIISVEGWTQMPDESVMKSDWGREDETVWPVFLSSLAVEEGGEGSRGEHTVSELLAGGRIRLF